MRKPLDVAFAEFHERHPEVYELFKGFALELYSAGRRRYGAKSIVERVRWHFAIQPDPKEEGEPFKIDNNFTSRLARLLAQELPQFRGFFEFRQLRC